MNSWDILGLAPTKDLGAIRRAYAATAAQYNPEDHPEEFLAVRQANEQVRSRRLPPRNGSPHRCHVRRRPSSPNAARKPAALRSGTSARRKIILHPRRWTILRSCTAPNSAETASSGTSGLPLRNS